MKKIVLVIIILIVIIFGFFLLSPNSRKNKIKEDMKKRADMYVSAENVTKLLEDLKT